MSHLTEEQFEDILQGSAGIPEHVDQCPDCRARLAEKRALAQRVRQAFSSLQASGDLADRIRAQAAAATEVRPRLVPLRTARRLWSAAAAVAAVLLLAVPIGFYVQTGAQARAAQHALVGIHHANLGSLSGAVLSDDPVRLHKDLEDKVGYCPGVPCDGSGLNVCGCGTPQFQGRTVASYVVKGPSVPISIVVVPHSPKALGMTRAKDEQTGIDRALWQAECRGCNMASVRIGAYSYCAIGQATQQELAAALGALRVE